MSVFIHPTAIVSPKAQLGENVRIGPFCMVDDKVMVGDNTELRAYVHIYNYTEMGSGCTVFDHTVIGGEPQDITFKNEETWVRIGNNLMCREYVTMNRAVGEGKATTVGDNCFIMENVHLAHNVQIGHDCTIANKCGFSGHTHIGDYVVVGGMAGFHQFVHVGSYCMIGGLSKIVRDVPPFCLANGSPIRVYDINRIGLKRRGFDSETRRRIRDMYRTLYDPARTIREGLAELEVKYGTTPEGRMILDFASESTRGLSPRINHDWERRDPGEKDID